MPEFSNEEITHNVEFSLHPSESIKILTLKKDLPVTPKKIFNCLEKNKIDIGTYTIRPNNLISKTNIIRNACTIAALDDSFVMAILNEYSTKSINIELIRLLNRPFAIVECKRVGIEDGTRKGPQTIEKAKQGAYVARSVSSLQRIRRPNGEIVGIYFTPRGEIIYKNYDSFIQEIVKSNDSDLLRNFILTIGVVSNHGNWFTSDNHNKELKVLAQSYDWLLFLTDSGLSEFISDLILRPADDNKAIRKSFLGSYKGNKGENQFTKVRIKYEAHRAIDNYFNNNVQKIESWFNVIVPKNKTLNLLREDLGYLSGKKWKEVHK